MPLPRSAAAAALLATLLTAAAPALAASDFAKAERRCTETARERGLTVNGINSIRTVGSNDIEVELNVPRAPDVRCVWDERRDRVSFPEGTGGRPAVVRPPEQMSPREACEAFADKEDIRIGRHEATRRLAANRYEVRFERPLFGERHKCFYDAQRRIASFEGEGSGGVVPGPARGPVDASTRAAAEGMCLEVARGVVGVEAPVASDARYSGSYVEVTIVSSAQPGEGARTCRYDPRRKAVAVLK